MGVAPPLPSPPTRPPDPGGRALTKPGRQSRAECSPARRKSPLQTPSWCGNADSPEIRMDRRPKGRARKKLRMLFVGGGALLLGVAPLAAQNSVDVLGGGPQPPDAPMPANWSSTSNANPTPADIPAPIAAYFVYVPDGAALPTD